MPTLQKDIAYTDRKERHRKNVRITSFFLKQDINSLEKMHIEFNLLLHKDPARV